MNSFKQYLGTMLLVHLEDQDPFESAIDAGLVDEIIQVSDELLGDCDFEEDDPLEDNHDREQEYVH